MLVYYISPVRSDPDYSLKRQVLANLSALHEVDFFFPLDSRPSFSVASALKDIKKSELVIADLSLERPSCYFEIGLAQSTDTPVALIAAIGTVLHQAGDVERVRNYADMSSFEAVLVSVLLDAFAK